MLVLSVSWPSAPKEAFIVGLKELPESEDPVIHRHIFYTHAHQVGPLLFNLRTERLYPNNSMYVFYTVFYPFSTIQIWRICFINDQEPLHDQVVTFRG